MPERPAGRPRLAWIAVPALALVVVLPLAARLAQVPAQAPLREWLIEEPSAFTAHPITLDVAEVIDQVEVYRLPLTAPDREALAGVDRLDLVMATHATAPDLVRATLTDTASGCGFATAPGTPLLNNDLVSFHRQTRCEGAGPASLVLEVRIAAGSGRVALWTLEDKSGRPRLLRAPPAGTQPLTVRGFAVRTPEPSAITRAGLLAALWNVPVTAVWTRVLVIGAMLLLGVAAVAWAEGTRGLSPRGWAGAGGVGAALSALALAHALAIPPLQGADEPTHMLSYVELLGHPTWKSDTEALARRSHFERIRHHGDQHYRASDLGHDWHEAWSASIAAVNVEARSPLTAWWWRTLDPYLRNHPVEAALWRMRTANAVLFGLAGAMAAALVAWLVPGAAASLGLLGVVMVPTLPFYGMLWGDAPVILAASLLLAAAVAPLALDSPRAWMSGAPIALALLLVLVSGRRAWPLAVAVGVVLFVHALRGIGVGPARARQRLWFWSSFLAVLMPGMVWTLGAGLYSDSGALLAPRAFLASGLMAAVLERPWLVGAVIALLPLVEWWWPRATGGGPVRGAPLWRRGMQVAAGLLVAGALVSRVVALPTTNGVLVSAAALAEYVWDVLRSMAVPFRTGHFDLLLSTFFWSGFGWVDVVVPDWLRAILGLSAAIVVGLWWWSAGRDVSGRRACGAAGLAIGLALALVVAAVGAYALHYELYGRYLLGWYLLLLVPAGAHLATTRVPWWPAYAGAMAVHAYGLQLILLRYF